MSADPKNAVGNSLLFFYYRKPFRLSVEIGIVFFELKAHWGITKHFRKSIAIDAKLFMVPFNMIIGSIRMLIHVLVDFENPC